MTNQSLEAILREAREQAAQPISPIDKLSNHSLLHSYENIRHQVEADKTLGHAYRLVGVAAKQRAELLRLELLRRGLHFTPIEWP